PGHLELFREMMDDITFEEVNAAVQKFFQFGNMHIVVVTPNAEAFRGALLRDSLSPITYATPKAASVLKEDKEIQVFPLKIGPRGVKVVRVEDIFEK
ncbi:MAG: hypothetical protein WBG01_15020, partial [Bacteroidota bacterium]